MDNTLPPRDHNKPPFAIEVRDRHKELFDKLDELSNVHEKVPPAIRDDDDEGKAQDLVLACKKALTTATALHKMEKEPFNEKIKELKNLFAIPMDKVEAASKAILEKLDVYKEKKAAAERRRREDEARKAAEEAARLQREAEEADRKRREAEEARRQEEERARKAQEERERAEREAREARERAERIKEEQARLEQERKERAELEKIEAAARAERTAKEQAEAAERRKAEEEAHKVKMAELAAQRAAEEAKMREAREAAAQALTERRQAEEAAAVAKREEKAATRDMDNNMEDAVRQERRAAKLDTASNASEADLSRGRGDYGSVGSRATFWTSRILDRDKIPLEALRAYIHPDAIDAAVTRFMNAHRPELGQGRDVNDLLPGVEFYRETTTRVA